MATTTETGERSVPTIIFEQLGGHKFQVMTGAKDFLGDGNTLRMSLPRNRSKANRLFITLDEGTDSYKMRFFYYFAGLLNHKTLTWTPDKITEVEAFEGVYAEDLCRLFTSVTGMHTRL